MADEKPKYIDDLTVRETYAETVQVLVQSSGAITIEFCVNRWTHEVPVHIDRITPVARLVMAPGLASALRDQLAARLQAAAEQAQLAATPAASNLKN